LGADQAIQNYILNSNNIGKFTILSHELGPVLNYVEGTGHLAYNAALGKFVNKIGDVAYIIHHFDKKQEIMDKLANKYSRAIVTIGVHK